MFSIIISEKGGQQSRLEFSKPEITIGRMKGNDIVLPKGNVSKRHATIYLRDAALFINDHGSTNGTYVNGRKVSGEQALSDADKIYIGDFILQADPQVSGQPTPAGNDFQVAPDNDMDNGRQGFETLFDPVGEIGNDPLRSTYSSPPPGDMPYADPGLANYDSMRSTQGDPAPPESRPNPFGNNTGAGGAFGSKPVGRGFNATPSATAPPTPPQPPNNPPVTAPPPVLPSNTAPQPAVTPQPVNIPQPVVTPQPVIARDPAPATTPPPAPITNPPPPVVRPTTGASYAVPTTNIVAAPEVTSEFDADFFRAQIDVARVLLEKYTIDTLPQSYPPTEEDRETFRNVVSQAITQINPQGIDRDKLAELLLAECVSLGPVDLYLDEFDTRDIYVNKYDQILVRRQGKLFQARHVFSSPEFLNLAATRLLGDAAGLGTDELRFEDGTRLHVVMPPLAVNNPLITIRKPPSEHPGLQDLISGDILSPGMADFLMRVIDAGRSVCVAGPTSSGKSTLLSALAGLVANNTRIISIKNYSQIELSQGSAVQLETSANFDKRFLLQSAMGMHPERIILDECRDAEAYGWVTSVASGTAGSMMTIHGINTNDALNRLESLCLLGSSDISPRGLREQIARAVNIVVVVNRDPSVGFRVQQITEVQGVDLDTFRLNDIFYHRVEGSVAAFHPTGYIPLFYEDLRHAGIDVDFNIFRD